MAQPACSTQVGLARWRLIRVDRRAFVVGIRPENVAEYEALHGRVWPAVLAAISASNIVNYSIYRYGHLLFSYFEYVGTDYPTDVARMAADEATQRWWALCMPMQVQTPDRIEGEWWTPLHEVFHHD